MHAAIRDLDVDELFDGAVSDDSRTDAAVPFSSHARTRQAQRGLSAAALDYVLTHGDLVRRAGAVFAILRRCDVPLEDRSSPVVARLDGTVVVLSPAGVVLTAYRNRKASRYVRKKARYASSRRDRQFNWLRVALAG